MIQIRNFINGQWQEETGGKTVPLYNPSTGETIGSVPVSNLRSRHRHRRRSLQDVAPRPHRQAHDLYP